MEVEYLLDTNTYFNILKDSANSNDDRTKKKIASLKKQSVFISQVTKIEIVSVLGKYARGNTGGHQRCTCVIDDNGTICTNDRYIPKRKPWKKRKIKDWLKLIDETQAGVSKYLNVNVVPFDQGTILCANEIIKGSIKFKYASMDALIAATAKQRNSTGKSVVVVTSDKALKACLKAYNIECYDIYE